MRVRVPPYPHEKMSKSNDFTAFSVGFSSHPDTKKACELAFEEAISKLDYPKDKDLVGVIFTNPKYEHEKIVDFFRHIDNVGTSTSGNITAKGEFEGEKSGLSILLIDKRFIYCETFSVSVPWRNPREIGEMIGERFKSPFSSSLILFATPFYDVQEILIGVARSKGNLDVCGGIASAPVGLPTYSFENGSISSYILSGVFMEGVTSSIRIASSCEPVSDYLIVTSAMENTIEEIEGESAKDVLEEIYMETIEKKSEIKRAPWFVGEVIDEKTGIMRFYRITDVNERNIRVAGNIQTGSVIRFAVMTTEFANKSLEQEFTSIPHDTEFLLIINCIARGSKLFGKPDPHISTIKKLINERNITVAGFFSNGEIATIGNKPQLITYTGVMAMFRRQPVA